MATFNLVINYPDAEGPRIIAALREHWTTYGATTVVPTTAQAVEQLRLSIAGRIREIVRQVELSAAVASAASALAPVTPT